MASSRRLPVSYDETTYDSAGGRDYSSLQVWEDATTVDCVSQSKGKVLTCYSGIHNDTVTLAGATVNSSYFRVIRAVNGSRGTKIDGVRFVVSGSAQIFIFVLNEQYSSVHDIAGKVTTTHNTPNAGSMPFRGTASNISFVGCTAYDVTTGTAASPIGFLSTENCYIINCNADNLGTQSGIFRSCVFLSGTEKTAYIYNCTFTNSPVGIMNNGSGFTVQSTNVILQNISTNYSGTVGTTTNATSGVTFDTDGYHLKQIVIGSALAQGTNLSADPNFAFDDDIDGTTITRAWAIGCDWYAPTQANVPAGSSRKLPSYYYESTYDSGGGKDYTSLSVWEDSTDIILTTPTVGFVLTCYDSQLHTDTVTLAGATTSSDYFRVIRAVNGSRGTPDDGVQFYSGSGSAGASIINADEDNVGFYDLYGHFVVGSNTRRVFRAGNYSNIKIIGCSGTVAGVGDSIVGTQNSTNVIIANCFAKGIASLGHGIYIQVTTSGTRTAYLYNNTITSANNGFLFQTNAGLTSNIYSTNNILQDNSTTINISGTGTLNHTPTTNITSGVTFEADGYHLSSSDTGAKNNGTNLSTDLVYAFADDIDGDIRNDDWDVGCDELIVTLVEEDLEFTILSDISVFDLQSYLESLFAELSSIFSLEELQTYLERLKPVIESEVSIEDFQNYIDSLFVNINSSILIEDLQNYLDGLLIDGNVNVSIDDKANLIDNIKVEINSLVSIEDLRRLTEGLIVNINSFFNISDSITYAENLIANLQIITSIIDKLSGKENLHVLGLSDVNIHDVGSFSQNLDILINSLVTIQDKELASTIGKIVLNLKINRDFYSTYIKTSQLRYSDINIKRR